MARITVEDCLVHENNRFALVQLAAKRTRQLLRGAKSKMSEVKNKHVVMSLREIADGLTRFMTAEEIEAAKRSKSEADSAPEAPATSESVN